MCRQADHPARGIAISASIEQFARPLAGLEQIAGLD